MSVTVRLEGQLDVSRGDMIVDAEDPPVSVRDLDAMVCWMTEAPLRVDGRYAIKHTTRSARAIVSELAPHSSHSFTAVLVGDPRGAQLQAGAPASG